MESVIPKSHRASISFSWPRYGAKQQGEEDLQGYIAFHLAGAEVGVTGKLELKPGPPYRGKNILVVSSAVQECARITTSLTPII
jgi:hypothetical protein